MKNYIIGVLILLVAALAVGVEPFQRIVNETTSQGTLRGVEKCLDYSKSELLSKDALRSVCVQSFQRRLYDSDAATGSAGPGIVQGKVGWEGTLENKTTDHVTTWVKVTVIIFDPDGKKHQANGDTTIWIDPLGKADFRVALPDIEPKQLEGVDFCDREDNAPKSCMSWGITDVKGLSI